MRRYWIRISLSALAIFVVGMLVVQAGKHGIAHVRELAMNHTFSLPGDVAPFKVDNRQLGLLRTISVTPGAEHSLPRINLTVEANDQADLASLDQCFLIARDADQLRNEGGLHCADRAAGEQANLREVGQVTFEPGGQAFSIFSPSNDQAVELRRSTSAAHAESFKLQANAAGAFMEVRDKNGRPVFQLNADSLGASLTVRDSNGKELVRLRADSNQLQAHTQH
jgi:hypothetical protein